MSSTATTSHVTVPSKRHRSALASYSDIDEFGPSGSDSDSSTSNGRAKHPRVTVDPYMTLPEPTENYITLYFKLCRFHRTFRIVQVPGNYTFANLHTLIQFLFGWSDYHLHQAEVVDHVVMYKTKQGEIRSSGRVSPVRLQRLHEWYGGERLDFEIDLLERSRHDDPLMRIQGGSRRELRRDWSYEFEESDSSIELKCDPEVTLSQVWNLDEERNASFRAGENCPNEEIAIKYQYDLGSSWNVHVSLNEKDPFRIVKPPSNLPIIVKANGVGTQEDPGYDDDWRSEPACSKKKIDPLFYMRDAFSCFCDRKIVSRVTHDKLWVYDVEEEKKRKEKELAEKAAARGQNGGKDIGEDEDEEENDEDNDEFDDE